MQRRLIGALLAAIVAACMATPSDARPQITDHQTVKATTHEVTARRYPRRAKKRIRMDNIQNQGTQTAVQQFRGGLGDDATPYQTAEPAHHVGSNRRRPATSATSGGVVVAMLPHPVGCPTRAFCGCGLRKYLGIDDASLNLAWNWARKFPRTHAQVGAAAVWGHHVAYIEGGSPGNWLMRDYNSGGNLSRLHYRSAAGAVFVLPSARLASL